jgi:hypothetical protein
MYASAPEATKLLRSNNNATAIERDKAWFPGVTTLTAPD